jgi:TolA-binding protein
MPSRSVCVVLFAVALGGRVPAQPPPLPTPGEPAKPGLPTGPAVNNSDIDLVERVMDARKSYVKSLKELHRHYVEAGDAERAKWVEDELLQYHRMQHYAYRLDLDVPSPKLQPLYNQAEANRLYRDAMAYKDRGLGGDYTDNQKRAELLLQRLLTEYPQSTKISDAAYQLGDLYEGRAFHQYPRAAAYFERCFQWNPATQFDARLRAARLYDRELKNRTRALELYRMVREYETDSGRIQEAERRIADLGGR